ncbi:PLP-dependent transferase [Prosthecochloris sp. N3]|uniref:PLP-dependent transferase n=1 Tax=Prosthecochloris ethylica TaxID=2743976 RepID=A0ABR9XT43_9CHLB|nr:PLP-dependent aspartate aminotransferase family protein [Prosthecochloris ethylica]MBF0587075.1 PLP-dependent transferase [Prosthecochloris ethylica]MBF0637227.1 PLP-dependent transferase [Prosthecochloris ethylica]NUK48228.1 PLP-dependent transferase [Prosthecochloris ethylica]
MSFQTDTVHAGVAPDPAYGAIMTPIYQSSTFVFEDIGRHKGFDYTRSGNPTRKALEDNLAALEGCSFAAAVTSGMAAIATVMHLFRTGDELICTDDCYGGTARLLKTLQEQFGLIVRFENLRNPGRLEQLITPATRAIWIETPSNPLLNLVDIEATAHTARAHGLLTIVDNTFLSPYLQKPFNLGADIVVHSTTKYLNGHSDVIGGALLSNSRELDERLKNLVNTLGTGAQPFDCWLVLRGIKTLVPRMKEHLANAAKIAEFLDGHRNVKQVFYPGLPSHPQHELARRQQNGFGAMVSFEIDGGIDNVNQILKRTRLFSLAESLGGVESLIEHPATMSHLSMGEDHRRKAGISDTVIRLSIGIEDPDDLIADLDQALGENKKTGDVVQ